MCEDTGAPFRVDYHPAISALFLAWITRITVPSIHQQFSDTLRTIEQRLRTEPCCWGEELYSLRHLGMVVRLGIESGLGVEYAVNASAQYVFVMGCILLGNNPFGLVP